MIVCISKDKMGLNARYDLRYDMWYFVKTFNICFKILKICHLENAFDIRHSAAYYWYTQISMFAFLLLHNKPFDVENARVAFCIILSIQSVFYQ